MMKLLLLLSLTEEQQESYTNPSVNCPKVEGAYQPQVGTHFDEGVGIVLQDNSSGFGVGRWESITT